MFENYRLEYALLIGLALLILPLLYRLWQGPTTSDRMLALEIIGSICVMMIITLSVIAGRTIYLDVAVLLALFSFLGTLAVARYVERGLI